MDEEMLMLWVNLCLLATRSLVDLGVLNARAVDWCRCCDTQMILQNHCSSKDYDSKYIRSYQLGPFISL